jgi:hypothetical protein
MKMLSKKMKKILFMTESYQPNPSPNANCVKKVLDELYKQKNDTFLITLKNAIGQKKFEDINGTKVLRINENFLNWCLINLKDKKNTYDTLLLKIVRLLLRIKGGLLGFVYPLLSPTEVIRYYFEAKKLCKDNNIDVVVCVYHKIAAVLAGILIKRKVPRIRFIVYTLDAISGGWIPNILRSSKIPLNSLKRWEKIIFRYADSICVMESHRGHYKSREYDWCREKIKYMDIPLLELRETKPIRYKKAIDIVYTGSMTRATADPNYFLKLIKKMNYNIQFHIYGNIAEDILADITNSGLIGSKIFIHGRVSIEEVEKIQNSADVLINFGCVNPNMIPCKIFEYISAKKPVLSFYKGDTDSSKPYFENFSGALLVYEDDNIIKENCDKVISFIENTSKIKIQDDDLLKRYYNNTPYPMVEEILD